MKKFFQYFLTFILLNLPVTLIAQNSITDSYQEAVNSRLEFQSQFPAAAKLFSGKLKSLGRTKLISAIRESHPTLVVDPSNPSFNDLWSDFTLGLALEKSKLGSGESELLVATQIAKGNVAVNYEMARIFLNVGSIAKAKSFQKAAIQSMLEKGYIRVPEFAKLELFHWREMMNSEKSVVAGLHLEFAAKLDPFCPWVPIHYLEMELREKSITDWDLGLIWARLWDAFRLLKVYDSQSLFIINVSRAIRFGLALFGILSILILFVRYFTRISHLTAEKLPRIVDLPLRYFALALIPFSLAVGGIGYVPLVVLCIMLLWRHCSKPEKFLLKISIVGLLLVPPMQMWEQTMVRHLDKEKGIGIYHQAYTKGYEKGIAEQLHVIPKKTSEDIFFSYLSGLVVYSKLGNYPKANEYGKSVEEIDATNPFLILNRGNLSLIKGEYAEANVKYEEARRYVPNWMEAWFNSSQAALYSNNSSAHKKFLDKAAELDAGLVNQYLKENDDNFQQIPPNRMIMVPMLRMSHAWQATLESLSNFDFLKIKMRMGLYSVTGVVYLSVVGLAAFLLFLRFRQYSPYRHGKDLFECKICEKVLCRVCRKGVHCHSCFDTVSNIHDNRLKLEKVRGMQVKAKVLDNSLAKFFNFLLPGSGHLYKGRGGASVIWLLMVSILLGGLWQSSHLLMEYPAFVLGPIPWLLWLPLLCVYVFFYLTLIRSRPSESFDSAPNIMSSTKAGAK